MSPLMSIDLDHPTGNFWVDNGLVVLIREFGEGVYEADEVLKWLLDKLVQKTGNKGEYYDEAIGQLCEYEKTNWAYPTNQFIKVAGGSEKKVEIDGKKYPTQPPEFELKLKLSKKPAICDLCGEQSLITDAKMWMFPFIVDPSKFGNFYSGAKRGVRLCSRCALAGLAGYLGWLWKAQGRDALHFFVFHSGLRTIERLQREVFQPLTIKNEKSGNAPVAFSGPYIHETTLGLLFALFSHIHQSEQLSEEGRKCLAEIFGVGITNTAPPPIVLYAVTGTPGNAFDMKVFREFTKLHSLYRLYEKWIDEITQKKISDNPAKHVATVFRQFETQRGNKRETLWRDKIAQAILEFDDPFPFVEKFLFESRVKEKNPRPLVWGTMDIFNIYLKEVLGMDEQFQRTLAGFGYTLGKMARENNDMGLLYALRNAKNPEEFYRVLNDAQFRLEMTVPEALLKIEKGERISGAPWVRVKTLLSIYAMNAFLRESAKQQKEEIQTSKEGVIDE